MKYLLDISSDIATERIIEGALSIRPKDIQFETFEVIEEEKKRLITLRINGIRISVYKKEISEVIKKRRFWFDKKRHFTDFRISVKGGNGAGWASITEEEFNKVSKHLRDIATKFYRTRALNDIGEMLR